MKLKLVFTVFLFVLMTCTSAISQKTPQQDSTVLSEKADSLLYIASALFNSNLDSALLYIEQALPLFYEAKNFSDYVATLNGISTFHYYRNDFEQLKKASQKALEEAEKLLGKENYDYSEGLNNMATIHRKRGNYDKSIQLLNQFIDINKERLDHKLELAIVYQNQAINFAFKDDFPKALDYQYQALKINLDSLNEDPIIVVNYNSIGLTYKDLMEFDSSLVYLNKALSMVSEPNIADKVKERNTIISLHGIAEVWLMKKNPRTANSYLQKALDLQKHENSFRKAFTFELLAKKFIEEKNYTEALESILMSNHLATINYKKSLLSNIPRKYLLTAEIYHLQNEIDSALVYAQKAIVEVAPDFLFRNKMDNPQAFQILDKSVSLNILTKKASLLLELYSSKKDTSLLIAALHTFEAGVELVRNRREQKLSIQAKNNLAEKSITIYEGAISTALELYKITNESKYKNKAFILAENNKSLLLLETINEQFAKGNAGLPDTLLKQEKDLKIDLAYYQKQILIEKQKKDKADQKKLKLWQDYLFKFQQEHDILISRLEENYSGYYNLKYNNKPASIEKIRTELLNSNNALVEYFVGDENIYIFCLTADDLQIKTINSSQLNLDEIQNLRTFVSTPPNQGISSASLQEYGTLAFKYYELLIKPVIDQLGDEVNELFIIPDGMLAYIPFDVLLTTPNDSNHSDLPNVENFLLHRYSIGYDYSATLLVKNTTKEVSSAKSNFIAFAPNFQGKIAMLRSCDGSELSQLKCNQEEVEKIGAILDGQLMIGPEASVANFSNLNDDYNIIHLATHACADTENPLSNKVYFSDNDMSILDFNNIHLNTQLVVLSACNTGYGKILRGEGVMSIARGLMVAGSPSTMLSLWSVDDCATSDLMGHYYANLKSGQSKNKALRNAKLKYVESAPKAMKHPFYWGAFVQFGNVEAIKFSAGNKLKYWGLGTFLFILVGILYFILIKSASPRQP